MGRGFVSIILTLILAVSLNGQVNKYGVPLFSTYSVELSGGAEYNHCMTKDANGIVYFGNDGRGVIRYDGTTWSLIPVRNKPTIYAIQSDENGIVYVGGSYEFGYIGPRKDGSLRYISLAERIDTVINIRTVYSIVVQDDRVYFSANRGIFTYFPANDSLAFFDSGSLGYRNLLTMIQFGDRIIIGDNLAGVLEFTGDSIFETPGGSFFTRKPVTVMLQLNSYELLIGTYDSGLFTYNLSTGEVKDSFVESDINERLKNAQIYKGVRSSDSLIILGTRNTEGVVVFDINGKQISRYASDLIGMDNDGVTALYVDPEDHSELWICTVGFITKVYLNLPFTHFSKSLGVSSGVNAIAEFNNSVFIGHDNGVSKTVPDTNGSPIFSPLPELSDAATSFELFNNGKEQFLLVGTQQGAYIIDKNDRVVSVEDNFESIAANKSDIRRITRSVNDPDLVYIGASNSLIFIRYQGNFRWKKLEHYRTQGYVNEIIESGENTLWFSVINGKSVFRLQISGIDTIRTEYGSNNGLPDLSGLNVKEVEGDILVTSPSGIYKYDPSTDLFTDANEIFHNFTSNHEISFLNRDTEGDFWISYTEKNSKGSRYLEALIPGDKNSEPVSYKPFYALPIAPAYDITEIDKDFWIAKSKSVFVVDKKSVKKKHKSFSTFINKIVIGNDSVILTNSFAKTDNTGRYYPTLNQGGLEPSRFPFNLNDVSFFWSSNYYVFEEQTEYSYFLEGNDKRWSNWEALHYKDFSNLKYGHYKLRVKARSVTMEESDESVYEFTILKPWYAKTGAILLYIIAFVGVILAIIKVYTKRLINENLRLEGIVRERTAVVVKQKEELESSIHYASRIQRALLPPEKILSDNVEDYFLLLKPRDIVSGDFYWMSRRENKLFVVAADCTGHGVPGAFMSLLGMSFLDEIVNKSDIQRTDNILGELRAYVTNSLRQVGEDDEAKDGMDLAIIMADFKTLKVEFSGAYSPCLKVRKITEEEKILFSKDNLPPNEGFMTDGKYVLETFYPSKMPIGISSRMNEKFALHEWDMEKGVSYYLFSDGYVDQFGSGGKKFMKKNFKRLLLDIQGNSMPKQKEILEETLKEWMGDTPQIDDILVMGIRIN